MLQALEDLLLECEVLHGHICPGQVLGVRMALLGCQLSGISDPRGVDRKKLIIWVEVDRCMTDALSAVTGEHNFDIVNPHHFPKMSLTYFHQIFFCNLHRSADRAKILTI